ncbi:hypothetical protein F5B20DRAFT_536135 [Whalleya microplaca]|nr:hypothetical protein F5B20DRAFT_536135 [Whalleya microplaca]
MALLDLPPETVALIIGFLVEEDLPSLIVAQSVCRYFHAAIQNIFPNPSSRPGAPDEAREARIHPLLMSRFNTLFDSANCFPESVKRRFLDEDIYLPFRKLPWASTEATRAPYLRPEASWRNMSVTWGGPRITRVDVCAVLTVYGGTSMRYYQLGLPPAGLTMGLLWDFLLGETSIFNVATTKWELRLGEHLHSYDEWQELSDRASYPSRESIERLIKGGAEARHSVTLLTFAHMGCTGFSDDDYGDLWCAEPIGAEKPVLHEWTGTMLPPRRRF